MSSSVRIEYFMGLALEEAKKALMEGEVPVGCVYTSPENDELISAGHNETNASKNATRHAELVAFEKAMLKRGNGECLAGADLFVTCEPCIMCAAALSTLRIGRVYFGCYNDKFGGCGSILELHNGRQPPSHSYPCQGGLRKEEAIDLLQEFYKQTNTNAPNPRQRRTLQAMCNDEV